MAGITPTYSEGEEPLPKSHDGDLPQRHRVTPASARVQRMLRAGQRPGDRVRTARSRTCPTSPSAPR